ncbi:MAG: Chaperone protein DnaK [Parcubacteria group bacterium GW2011_GWA2_47_12]|nr:MAG: Chaperone protein DnaK [Parcubacteria group bacterium GW2011_GWA2_47_12]
MSKILGIDLGTTYSAMAVVEGGTPRIIENSEGARTTPSIVALSKTGERLAGLLAKRQAVTNPKNTVYTIKRFIGHSFDDPAVQKDIKTVPYEVRKSASGGIEVKIGDKWERPEEISAKIIAKLKADAEARLGEKITEAVITVPAYFNDSQRQATKDAGFDISVLEVGDDVIEVKATDGDSHLGGHDIDQKIIGYIADEFKKQEGIDIRKDALALQRLEEAAEKAKIELSTALESEINLPFISSGAEGPKHLVLKLSRAKLEELTREFIERAMTITKRAIGASPFKIPDIDEVVMVGGQTRMPAIQKAVKDFFKKEPHFGVNPDEVVAVGAAIQGGILAGDVRDVLLLDVIPLSFGLETLGGVATKLVERNTTIPVTKSQVFSTAADNQTSVEIHIVQGERPMAADNKSLGRFILDGIPPAPRGLPQVEVSFDIDANGILNVKAKDKTSGKEQSIKIEARSTLTKEEIERMKKDAESHAADDEKKREFAEVKNLGEQLAYTAEKALKDAGEKVPAENRKSIEDKISDLKNANKGTDISQIKTATQNLSTELQKIGEILAKQQQQNPEPPKDDKSSEGNVRDAETK